MADITEWIKGISFFLFVTLLFYLLWDNIFSNLINYVGTDMLGTGETTSITILKTMAWVSFIFIYLSVSPIYLFYSIVNGSKGGEKTKPLNFLKAISVWSVSMILLIIIFGLVFNLVSILNGIDIAPEIESSATTFSWIITLLAIIGINIVPFYYIIEGYGINLIGKTEQ